MGNHDIKYNDIGTSYPFSFVTLPEFIEKATSKIEVILEHKMEKLGNKNFLFLPYRLPVDGIGNKLYSSPIPDYSEKQFDSVFGHFTEESLNSFFGEPINISWINTKDRCFGHIHNSDGKVYLGSIVPNSVSEAGKDRFIKVYDLEGTEQPKLEKIPPIFDYSTVNYPDNLPSTNASVTSWTIDNCVDEITARSRYGNIYIRQVLYNNKASYSSEGATMNSDINKDEELSSLVLFDMWAGEAKLEDSIKKKARKYLES